MELTERMAAETPATSEEADRINRDYAQDCRRLGIIYADAPLSPFFKPGAFDSQNTGWRRAPTCTLV